MNKVKLRPMLATPFEEARVKKQLPVFAQPKYDGIRCLIKDGIGYSRTLKPIPNRYIQAEISKHKEYLEGFDGELIIGKPNSPDVYNRTVSGVMAFHGEPDFSFYLFDLWNSPHIYASRKIQVEAALRREPKWLSITPSFLCESVATIMNYLDLALCEGYEGIILRAPMHKYKFGRATPAQGQLVKVKNFVDTEAEIIDFVEMYHNDNEAFTNELGYTARTTHKANKTPAGILGALVCKYTMPGGTEVTFEIGTGFTMNERAEFWGRRDSLRGEMVKFKYLNIGVVDKPRHPVFLGFRHKDDM